jgi:MFS family permease
MLFGLGHSLVYPVLSVWMSEGVDPARRAGPQAWLNAFFNVGLYATPLPETWLVAGFGYDWTMIVLSGICSAFALFLWLRGLRAG